jgi:hypothetical protein
VALHEALAGSRRGPRMSTEIAVGAGHQIE